MNFGEDQISVEASVNDRKTCDLCQSKELKWEIVTFHWAYWNPGWVINDCQYLYFTCSIRDCLDKYNKRVCLATLLSDCNCQYQFEIVEPYEVLINYLTSNSD